MLLPGPIAIITPTSPSLVTPSACKGLDFDGWKIEVPQAVEQYAVLHYLPQIVTHSLTVGDTNIAYEVRFSDWAKRKRIEVIPSGVLVVAPRGTRWDGV